MPLHRGLHQPKKLFFCRGGGWVGLVGVGYYFMCQIHVSVLCLSWLWFWLVFDFWFFCRQMIIMSLDYYVIINNVNIIIIKTLLCRCLWWQNRTSTSPASLKPHQTFLTRVMSTVSFPLLTAIVLVVAICRASVVPSNTSNYKYAVIIDAGSSGTRVWVYRWASDYHLGLPRYEKVNSSKNTPGLSTLETSQAISVKITELLEAAKVWVPLEERSKTPVYLFATAGWSGLEV